MSNVAFDCFQMLDMEHLVITLDVNSSHNFDLVLRVRKPEMCVVSELT